MFKKLTFLLFFVMGATSLFSQTDTLITRKGEKIPCKITEIGEDEIKYKRADNPDGPVYSSHKNKLREMVFANGTRELIKQDELAVDNKSTVELLNETRAFKVEPFTLFLNHFCVGYEQMLKVGTNLEVKAGFINSSINTNVSQYYYGTNGIKGGYIKPGIKFLLGQDFVMRGMRYAHPLKGRYIRFDADFVFMNMTGLKNYYYYGYGNPTANQTSDANIYGYGLFVTYGRQFVLGDIMTFDYYVGIGGSGKTINYTNPSFLNGPSGSGYRYEQNISNYYSHYRTPGGFSMQFGLAIGFISKGKTKTIANKTITTNKK